MPPRKRADAAPKPEAFAHIHDLFASFGAVDVRRMFGGAGIYADGVMFALVVGEAVYLKADAATRDAFEREGCGPFSYAAKDGKRSVMSYWRMPDRLYDDPDELAQWARNSAAVAKSARTKKPVKNKRQPRRQ